jgi:hypothetical protein
MRRFEQSLENGLIDIQDIDGDASRDILSDASDVRPCI